MLEVLDIQIPVELALPGGSGGPNGFISLVAAATGTPEIRQPGKDYFTYTRSEPHLEEQHQVASTAHSFTVVMANGTGYSDFVLILILAVCVRWIWRWSISRLLARYQSVRNRGFPK